MRLYAVKIVAPPPCITTWSLHSHQLFPTLVYMAKVSREAHICHLENEKKYPFLLEKL